MKQQPSQKEEKQKKRQKKPENSGLQAYAKYSGLAFQMIAIILLTTWGGTKLDKILEMKKPVFTIILSLIGVFAAIYTSVKDFIKK
jgi:F0F1-type ATP synthase assembly protein I